MAARFQLSVVPCPGYWAFEVGGVERGDGEVDSTPTFLPRFREELAKPSAPGAVEYRLPLAIFKFGADAAGEEHFND